MLRSYTPAFQRAIVPCAARGPTATPLRVGEITQLFELLERPRRRSEKPQREPSPYDGLADVAGCRRLADREHGAVLNLRPPAHRRKASGIASLP
jgi:hypothetical protein